METVLSYHDSILYAEDIELLKGPHWLNDRVIAFYFEYLSRDAYPQPALLLISGSETYLLATLGADGAAIVLQPREFGAAQLSLFAVNDNPDAQQANGGSHWSLLAYSADDNIFRHYDSMSGSNRAAARRVFEAARLPGSQLHEEASPQQQNGYDCGMYVLALARLLCQRHAEQGPHMSYKVGREDITPADVKALRQELLQLIRSKTAAAAAEEDGSKG